MRTLTDKTDLSKDKGKKIERDIRIIFASIFAICLMISIGYLIYTIYEIYETDLSSLENVMEVWHYMGRNVVAFEASILSFLLFVVALKI
jgi:hypothetical protein